MASFKTEVKFEIREPDELAGIFEDFESDMEREMRRAAKDIGERFENEVKAHIMMEPTQYETGLMVNSVDWDVEESGKFVFNVLAGTDVYYSKYQDALYPFMEPALKAVEPYALLRFQQAIKSASPEGGGMLGSIGGFGGGMF